MDDPFKQKRFAVLVDGDNAQASILDQVLIEAAKYGRITIKRIYGDWTMPSMSGWRDAVLELAMQPVQQFRNTAGKNATDSAMIIDAIEILNRKLVDGFCIVSSDSDFTRLATRIKEDGLVALGVGERKTPNAFVKACDVFVYTENLKSPVKTAETRVQPAKAVSNAGSKTKQPAAKASQSSLISDQARQALKMFLKEGFGQSATNDGWISLGGFGHVLQTINPAFDPREYGHSKLSQLLKEFPDFLELKQDETQFPPVLYVRLKA